jgi:hypothetical protein
MTSFNNFEILGVEGVIINFIFKPFITRMTKMQKELKVQENMSLYCEIRQFITYVRYVSLELRI